MTHLDEINHILGNHEGYSDKERKTWRKLAENINEEEQSRLAEALRLYSEQLPDDIRNSLKKEGLAERVDDAFIEAQYALTTPEETADFVEKVQESYAKIQKDGISEETIKSLINNVENEDDALRILVSYGPEGIEDIEDLLVEEYISGKSNYSFAEIIDLLTHFVHTKNIIAEENHKFKLNTIETYNKSLKRAQEIQRQKVERANHMYDRLLEN